MKHGELLFPATGLLPRLVVAVLSAYDRVGIYDACRVSPCVSLVRSRVGSASACPAPPLSGADLVASQRSGGGKTAIVVILLASAR
ncbi:hypothetical protein GCM10009764_28710 [Nocardia ninae]|uniref:Uncharacterized protein n=1 Tax=Nocardia ninae NBRC 108245 TaxID=1210091 RepID=A0A511MNZ1_9NOCA|nr:hypothetical protein NN4_68520 [Nocardia ninae NBRC 108245]